MHFRCRQTDDIIDAALQVDRLALRAEILEHVRLGHRHIDAAQIKQIIEVRSRPMSHDRQNAEVIAVIEDLREFVRKGHVAAR